MKVDLAVNKHNLYNYLTIISKCADANTCSLKNKVRSVKS